MNRRLLFAGTAAYAGLLALHAHARPTPPPPLQPNPGARAYGVNRRVDQRAPTSGDDSTRGYLVGDLWRAPSGAMYSCVVNTAGDAVWLPTRNTATPLPGNAAANLAACYGLRRLVAGYAGNAFTVQRASDSTTLAIGFLSSGQPDVEALGKFLLGTIGRLTTLNDQSGAALDATQGTFANAPIVMVYGDSVRLVFDEFETTGNINKWLNLPVGLALTKNACTAISMQGVISGPNAGAGLWQIGSVSGSDCIQCLHFSGSGTTIAFTTLTVGAPPCSPQIVAGVFPASGVTTLMADGGVAPTTRAVYSSVALTGGVIGDVSTLITNHSAAATGSSEFFAALFYSAALSTTTDVPAVMAALHSTFGTCPQARDNVLFVGESNAEGLKSQYGQSWVAQTQRLLGPSVRVFDQGVSSATVAQMQTKFAFASEGSGVGARASHNNICVFNVGANDIYASGSTAAQTWAAVAAFIPVIQAAGFSQVLVCTEPDRPGTAGQIAEKDALSALIRANAPGLGCGIIDIAANPLIGADGQYANTTYYNADQLHFTAQGAAVAAALTADAVSAVLQP